MLSLESFVYSSPFGMGPIFEYAYTGQVSIDPAGYAAWGALSATVEYSLFGATKFSVFAPAVADALVGELGVLRVLGITRAAAVATPIGAVTALAYAAGQPHPSEFNLHRHRSR